MIEEDRLDLKSGDEDAGLALAAKNEKPVQH